MNRNYFQAIENNNKRFLPNNRVWVIRMDARGSKYVPNVLSIEPGDMGFKLREAAKTLSLRYPGCMVYTESDELSIVFTDTSRLMDVIKVAEMNKLNSLLGQQLFAIYNEGVTDIQTFFDCKTFYLKPGKIISYLKYRRIFAENFSLNYYSKQVKYKGRMGKKNSFLKQKLKEFDIDWDKLPVHCRYGSLFVDGKEVNMINDKAMIDGLSKYYDIGDDSFFYNVDIF